MPGPSDVVSSNPPGAIDPTAHHDNSPAASSGGAATKADGKKAQISLDDIKKIFNEPVHTKLVLLSGVIRSYLDKTAESESVIASYKNYKDAIQLALKGYNLASDRDSLDKIQAMLIREGNNAINNLKDDSSRDKDLLAKKRELLKAKHKEAVADAISNLYPSQISQKVDIKKAGTSAASKIKGGRASMGENSNRIKNPTPDVPSITSKAGFSRTVPKTQENMERVGIFPKVKPIKAWRLHSSDTTNDKTPASPLVPKDASDAASKEFINNVNNAVRGVPKGGAAVVRAIDQGNNDDNRISNTPNSLSPTKPLRLP